MNFRFCLFLLAFALLSPIYAGDTVGHGGDSLPSFFSAARKRSSFRVIQYLSTLSSEIVGEDEIRKWLRLNGKELSFDIILSPHLWTGGKQASCAITKTYPHHSISLSLETCRGIEKIAGSAEKTLIYESVLHFGVGDESFARSVSEHIFLATLPAYNCKVSSLEPITTVLKKPDSFQIDLKNNAHLTVLENKNSYVDFRINGDYLEIQIGLNGASNAKYLTFQSVPLGTETMSIISQETLTYVFCSLVK